MNKEEAYNTLHKYADKIGTVSMDFWGQKDRKLVKECIDIIADKKKEMPPLYYDIRNTNLTQLGMQIPGQPRIDMRQKQFYNPKPKNKRTN